MARRCHNEITNGEKKGKNICIRKTKESLESFKNDACQILFQIKEYSEKFLNSENYT